MMTYEFRVALEYRDAQAFIDEDPQRTHDRLTKQIYDLMVAEFFVANKVMVEVEPA